MRDAGYGAGAGRRASGGPAQARRQDGRGTHRWWSAAACAALVLAALPVVTGALPVAPATVARADEITGSQNNLRTGWDPNEPGLSPSVVAGPSFGLLFSRRVNGQVYAQPIVAGKTLIVATETDWVYGLNAATGAVQWSTSLGRPWRVHGCRDLTPYVGVTGTPVYDAAKGTVYVVAETVPPHHSDRQPRFHLVALRASNGRILWQKLIYGTPRNGHRHRFNAYRQLQRPALLRIGRWVYIAFGSHCDHRPYVGYVADVNIVNRKATLWSDESGVADRMAGIWQSGGGLMSDGHGHIFLTSGNGISPAPGRGTSPPGQLAESVVRLARRPNGRLVAKDFFSPADAPKLDAADADFGSGAPVGLPFGTRKYPGLLVQAGKDGRVFLLNRSNLGGREQGRHHTDAAVSVAGPFGGQWGHPAAFGDTPVVTTGNVASSHDYVYYLGKRDRLRALQFGLNGRTPVLRPVASSTFTFGYTSGSPVVTSNGTDPSSAVVWVIYADGAQGYRGTLDAFDAMPQQVGGTLQLKLIWSARIGTATKFGVPATDGGRVYVATRSGRVEAFGTTTGAPLGGAAPVTFPATAVGSTSTLPVTETASSDVTVTGDSVSSTSSPDPFGAGQVTVLRSGSGTPVPVTLPVSLSPGDQITVQASFSPTSPGGAVGSLSLATSDPAFPVVSVPLTGNGVSTGLYAQPTSLPFLLVTDNSVTNVPVGIPVPMTVDVTNGGTSAVTVTSARPPAGPFSAVGLPSPGTVIAPGQSIVVQVTFSPVRAGDASSSFTIGESGGRSLTVPVSGRGLAAVGRMTASRTVVNFGSVRVGGHTGTTVAIANTGNQPVTVTRVSRLSAPFAAPYRVAAGLPVNPTYNLAIELTFSPAKAGVFTERYRLVWTDRSGRHTVTLLLEGRGVR